MREPDGMDAQYERMADAGELRELALRRFLRELVEKEGKLEAGALGVNYKTLARHEKSGELSARLSQALELLLQFPQDRRTGARANCQQSLRRPGRGARRQARPRVKAVSRRARCGGVVQGKRKLQKYNRLRFPTGFMRVQIPAGRSR